LFTPPSPLPPRDKVVKYTQLQTFACRVVYRNELDAKHKKTKGAMECRSFAFLCSILRIAGWA
jgi:hypothetical protein